MPDVVIMDTETTGLAHEDHIWEFAAIRLAENGTTSRYHFFVQHDLAKAEQLPDSFRADHDARYNASIALTPSQFVQILQPVFAGRPHIIGAVPNFDTERLARLLRHYGIDRELWHYHLRDIENIATGYLYGRASLGDEAARVALDNADDSDALSRAVGVEPPGDGVRHTAMGDVEWAYAVWQAVTGAKVGA